MAFLYCRWKRFNGRACVGVWGEFRACGAVFRIGEQRFCVEKKTGQSG